MQNKEVDVWVTIKGFSNYEVSNTGKVRSKNYGKSNTIKEMKLTPSRTGYLLISIISDNGTRETKSIHRLVAACFIQEFDGQEINHIDGIKTNNFVSNLELSSRSDNLKHAYSTGLIKPKVGSKNGRSKLTEAQVKEIRDIAANSGRYYGRAALAAKYGVSECTIKEVIVRRKNKFYNVH